MNNSAAFLELSPCTLADVLSRDRVMHHGIHPMWNHMPRIAGPAFPVRCGPADNLMLQAAIYQAPPGSIIVCEAGDQDYAVAGGNVCAVAQKRGIAGFVIDGVIRDIAETRVNRFPVFARGLSPIPGSKDAIGVFNDTIHCGGVRVDPGDMIVADEEGIVVVPHGRLEEVLKNALAKAAKDASETLEDWEAAHHAKIEQILRAKGISDHIAGPGKAAFAQQIPDPARPMSDAQHGSLR